LDLNAEGKVSSSLLMGNEHTVCRMNFYGRVTFEKGIKLDVTKASVSDSIPTIVLNKCAFQLAASLTKLRLLEVC
jgi:hypothetical protein